MPKACSTACPDNNNNNNEREDISNEMACQVCETRPRRCCLTRTNSAGCYIIDPSIERIKVSQYLAFGDSSSFHCTLAWQRAKAGVVGAKLVLVLPFRFVLSHHISQLFFHVFLSDRFAICRLFTYCQRSERTTSAQFQSGNGRITCHGIWQKQREEEEEANAVGI